MSALALHQIGSRHSVLAPTRSPKPRVTTASAGIARPSCEEITEASQIIAKSGWVEMIEPLMPWAAREALGVSLGGRKPDVSVKAFLTGSLMLAIMERPIFIRDVWRLLEFGLDSASRKHLGLDPKLKITERMVSYCFSLIAGALDSSLYGSSNQGFYDVLKMKALLGMSSEEELDPYEHAVIIEEILKEKEVRLDQFIRNGLVATHPTDAPHEGDYSLDGTHVASWEASKRSRRRLYYTDSNGVKRRRMARPHEMSDPDATWWTKGDESGLGYLVSAVTWMEKDCGVNSRGPDLPYLIDHFSVKTARTPGASEGARVVEQMISHHEREDELAGVADRVRADITVDREYSVSRDWQWRMHKVGLTPHFLLPKDQLGHTTTLKSGAIIVDGIAYSPGMPESLRKSMDPVMFASRDDRAAVAAFNLQRAPFRIRAYGGARQDDGSLKFYCPASNLAKASISCDNKPLSKVGKANRIQIGNALPVIVLTPKPAICDQSSVTVSFKESAYWQPYIPGTPEHQWSVNRRNLIESAFSRLKDGATQSVRRGSFRVMGQAKVSFVVLLNAMASNLAEVTRWRMRKSGVFSLDPEREIKVRQPRRHTRARARAAASRQKLLAEREAKRALAEMGLIVDLKTGEILGVAEPPPAP